jgi:hypothetical protein
VITFVLVGRFCRTEVGDHFVGRFWFLQPEVLIVFADYLGRNMKKPRLRSVKAMLSETLRQLDDIINSNSDELKIGKRADAITTKAGLLQSLFLAQSEEKKARLKHADVDALTKEIERLRAENEQLRSELGKAPAPKMDREETFDEKLARLVPSAKNTEEGSCIRV